MIILYIIKSRQRNTKFLLSNQLNGLKPASFWQIAKTARLVVCPAHSDMKSLTNGIVSAARDLKSWIDVRDSKFRSEMKGCLYREFHWVIHLLLCDGEKSEEIIKILREEILEAMCWQSDDLFCGGLMWITERKQVRFITRFMIIAHSTQSLIPVPGI